MYLRRHLPIIGPMLFGLARFSAPQCLKQETAISPVPSDSTLSHVSSSAGAALILSPALKPAPPG